MPPHRWNFSRPAVFALLALACLAPPAHALRVVTWNITQYPGLALSTRQPHFRTVMAAMNADVVIAQELNSAAGRDSFLTNVLNVVQPGEWSATSWFQLASNSEGGALFYKTAKVTVVGAASFSTGGPRDVLVCLVKPVGYTSNAAATRVYSVHLKAGGPATVDSTTRRNECASLRSTLNALPAGTSFLVGGDTNIYGAYEGAYLRLTETQADNDGRCKDPLSMPGTWHTNSGYALYHTQCPCNTGCIGGFSGGGMDDRFDLWLSSYSMQDGEGIDYVTDFTVANGAYPYSYGNDGTKYNNDINSGGTNGMVPIAVANALHDASDHLPVVITLQVPAKVVAGSPLAFGNVLIGATANLNLPVSNGATAPADELTYTLTAPADFTAPGGTFAADAGVAANNHAIGMSTASVGVKGGTLTVNSDDVDLPVENVTLSGTVLDHAASSLDSSAALLTTPVDFGDHAVGGFSNQPVRVHNLGWDALKAQLSVNSANIVGGDGRFSIVGGFTPTLLSGLGQTWSLAFNEVGATLDQEYTATLTFACADEALPGAAAANDLVVTLRAKPLSGTTGVPGVDLPKALAFDAPRPNPLSRETLFAFDLPEAAPVSLAIYDLTGRRIASIVSGSLGAGRYQFPWSAMTEGGARVPGGLYFARFITPGMTRVSRLIVLP
jgi:endonuclease/exonuclease/phosphatase family metal-dependent hydrolase